ncbi:MAG: ribosome silencing factor [Bacteroidota bacterium]|jgi:ribosome-associated protein|nr:ribosome silencing factor [Bacteroidota bacterium]|tara:strand:- start:1679 stop:2056 length:378 start_codon:yes stop_codon:yes gene_type:complete
MLENTKLLSTDTLITNIIEGIDNLKGEKINIIDLRKIDNSVCKYFIICSGNSNTHVKSISNSIQKHVWKETNENPWHVEGEERCDWILIDYVDIAVHIFKKETRIFYDLESLWGDAKQILIEEKK